tara:strand:- start:4654 stop:5007 length:354 start_codon:yes stop_codon:yes gene_type:complete
MAIQSGKNIGVTPLNGTGGDKTLHNQATRSMITAFNLKNNSALEAIVRIFVSPTSASSAGDRVAEITIEAGGSADVLEMIGEGVLATYFVVAKVTTIGINNGDVLSNLTYTLFTESS